MPRTQFSSREIGSVQRNDFDTTTVGQAVITKIVQGTGVTISSTGVDAGTGDVTINATSSAVTFVSTEISLGSVPRRDGYFNITTSGLVSGKPVQIFQGNGPYTNKGTREDESEMDGVMFFGKTTSTTNIKCYWHSPTFVKGNFKINYLVGA